MTRQTNSESGKALIELAFVLPFLFLTVLPSFDTSHSLRVHQYLSVAVREVGIDAYRSCIDSAGRTATNACLKQAAEGVYEYLEGEEGVLQGVDIGVKLYRVRYLGSTPLSPVLGGEYLSSNTLNSRYTASTIASLHSYLPGKKAIVSVEVFFQKQGWSAYFSREHYETAII